MRRLAAGDADRDRVRGKARLRAAVGATTASCPLVVRHHDPYPPSRRDRVGQVEESPKVTAGPHGESDDAFLASPFRCELGEPRDDDLSEQGIRVDHERRAVVTHDLRSSVGVEPAVPKSLGVARDEADTV